LRTETIKKALKAGSGVLRLAPTWVPRTFTAPGGRLKLHPKDLYALGKDRGGICERWIASTVKADNGPGTSETEGLSYIVVNTNGGPEKVLLNETIELMGEDLLGKEVMSKFNGWKVLAKLFDNQDPLPHHVHLDDEHAAKVGALGKPEAYYFPKQLNLTGGDFPYTFFGFRPGTIKEDIIKCLERFDEGDNGIIEFSQAYKLTPGTAWAVPAGLLHAPGSLVTYEPQRASDVLAMFQSVVHGRIIPRELLVKDVPRELQNNLDYLMSLLDWEANVDPYLAKNRSLKIIPAGPLEKMKNEGYRENWITYGTEYFSAKELTVFPGRSLTIKDEAAYGAILLQGHGKIGTLKVEAPALIRYGEYTNDEVFVTFQAAKEGIKIVNESDQDELVLLKHFGPENSEAPVNR
jgi:hypothetical protein